jgi:riboflavin biosynthesis pyrimidine reductase
LSLGIAANGSTDQHHGNDRRRRRRRERLDVADGGHDEASLSLFTGDARYCWVARPTTSRGLLADAGRWATAIEGDAIDGVRRLKGEHDGDLVMSGCGELARELIRAGLVDELLFWIQPRIQGPVTRPYEASMVPVRLLEAKAFESGVTLLRYQPLSAAIDR